MDFITHSLIGVGVARLATPRSELRPQTTLAAILGSLVMDNDSWLALVGPDAYGLYHRVFTHSLVGLALGALVAAGAARLVGRRWRRTGWFLNDNLPALAPDPPRAGWGLLLGVTALAAGLHWLGDAITGYGNLRPLWPWSRWEVNLGLTLSFDWFIFSMTIAWHAGARQLDWPRRREIWLGAGWLLAVLGYLWWRHLLGVRTVW